VLDSSTWITPSLPTVSIALAMTSPISGSPAETGGHGRYPHLRLQLAGLS